MNKIDELSVKSIRFLAAEAVEKAKSGHPGLAIDAAPMAYTLWKQMKHNPKDPEWQGRDRFVLSAGHASVLESSASLWLRTDYRGFKELPPVGQPYPRSPGVPPHQGR